MITLKFKQISAVKVGRDYDIVVFALDMEGNMHALHTHAGKLGTGDWSRIGYQEPEK